MTVWQLLLARELRLIGVCGNPVPLAGGRWCPTLPGSGGLGKKGTRQSQFFSPHPWQLTKREGPGRAGHVGGCWTPLPWGPLDPGRLPVAGGAPEASPASTDDTRAEGLRGGAACLSQRRVRGRWRGKASMHREPWAPQGLCGGCFLFTVGIFVKLEKIHYRHQKL